MSTSPPRLLAGAALLYWGYLTGHLAAAIPAAVLIESGALLKIRWDFSYDSYVRAWHFSILCGVLAAFLVWISGMKVWNVHIIFVWAPFILLPVELAQRFGKADKMPLNTFSFFASRQMKHDIQQGLEVSPRMINTGYPYIAITLVATAKAARDSDLHFIGLILIISMCLFAYVRRGGYRPWAWASAILLLIIFSLISQWGMTQLYRYYRGGGEHNATSQNMSANETNTSIGRLGRIKLNPRIFWRMQVAQGRTPKRLGAAVYNSYSRARWSHEFRTRADEEYDDEGYRPQNSAAASAEESRDIRWFTEETPKLTNSPALTIIGRVDAKVTERPLPLPHKFLAIGDLDAESSIECNRLGTVRLANPNYNVVEYSVWPGDVSTTEEPPYQTSRRQGNLDLTLPASEREALQRICGQLDLYNPSLTTKDKIDKIKRFFFEHFEYSTHLTTPRFDRGKRSKSISIFLEETRTGHCEYFATATTLLLREAGVPARYCIGFAVHERDVKRDEWIIRGQHAHAWCRAWIEKTSASGDVTGSWEDVDLTPASWRAMELAGSATWNRKLADWWQRAREDFLIWRTREANKTKVFTVIAAVVSLLLLWILWRLWSTRQRDVYAKPNHYQRPEDSPLTALHKLERLAAKKMGPRPVGKPLCQWLLGILNRDPSSVVELQKLLRPAITLHSAIRFDPAGAAPGQAEKLTELCELLKKAIKKMPSQRSAAQLPGRQNRAF